MPDNQNTARNGITSFSCRLLIKNGEAYLMEPSPEMCHFFGTTEADYQNGIIRRIRRDISGKSADALQALLNEKAAAGEDFRIAYPSRRADGSTCEMQLDAYAAETADGGRVYHVIEMDVTDIVESRRQAEAKYESAQSFLNSISDSYIATFRADISNNLAESVNGTAPLLTRQEALSYDGILQGVAQTLTRSGDRQRFLELFSRESLLSAYRSGKSELSMDYLYRQDASRRPAWARATINLLRRPSDNDIVAFGAVSDIDHFKTVDIIMNSALVKEYDFIACIDVATRRVDFVSVNRQTETMETLVAGNDFDRITAEYTPLHVPEESRASYAAFFDLAHVIRELEKADG